MKHFITLLSFFILTTTASRIKAQEQTYNKTQIQADIAFLKSELEQSHPDIYKFTTKKRFDFICDSLSTNAPESADLRQTFVHLLKIVNEIKCGHTYFKEDKRLIPNSVMGDGFVWGITNPKFLPLEVYIKDEQIFILRSYAKDKYNLDRGDEIVSINNYSAKDILKVLTEYNYNHPDGDSPNGKKYYLTKNFKFLLYLWLGFQQNYFLEVKRLDVKYIENVIIPPINLTTILKIDESRNIENINDSNNITFTIIDSLPNTAYVRIKYFLSVGSNNLFLSDFEKKTAYIFKELKKKKIKNIILDFRGNSGGDINFTNKFLSYLIPHTFVSPHISVRDGALPKVPIEQDLFSPSNLNKFKTKIDNDFWEYNGSNIKIQPNKDLVFNGNTYVLINGGTFSAACYFASKLYNEGIGTFIGTSTGGTYIGSSAGTFYSLKLPNTKLEVNLPLLRILHNVDLQRYKETYIKPDFEVKLNFEDFLKKRDTIMNYTIELIRQGKTAR
jgi:Peptidase family S41